MLRLARQLSVLVLCACASAAASAEHIDFNDHDAFAWSGQSIESGGFSFLALEVGTLGFISVDAQPDIVGNGSRRLLSGNNTEIVMTKADGGTFDLLGLAYGGSFVDQQFRWADSIEILGRSVSGRVVSRSQVGLAGLRPEPSYASFSDFTGVQSVLFRPMKLGTNPGNNFEFVLDDIRVSAVPEPDSWILLSAGLAGLAIAYRLRRGSTARSA